jgi:hypothetical protein
VKTLTIEGKLSNIDGVMFKRGIGANGSDVIGVYFYTTYTPELMKRCLASGIDQLRPAKVTMLVEQEEP